MHNIHSLGESSSGFLDRRAPVRSSIPNHAALSPGRSALRPQIRIENPSGADALPLFFAYLPDHGINCYNIFCPKEADCTLF